MGSSLVYSDLYGCDNDDDDDEDDDDDDCMERDMMDDRSPDRDDDGEFKFHNRIDCPSLPFHYIFTRKK